MPLRNEIVPRATFAEIQEGEPPAERKCTDCGGDGVLPVINRAGEQCGVTRCMTCGGTRYAP